MLGAQGEGGIFLAVGENLLHFLQGGGRHHKFHGSAGVLLRVEGAPGQTESVHGDGGDGIPGDLELDAGVNGSALILRHGKNGAGDQVFQLSLRDQHRTAVVDIRQLGVVLCGFRGDGKGGIAGADGYLIALVHHHGDRPLRQTADDIPEEPCRENAPAGIGNLGLDVIGDGGFHIIAGEAQTVARDAEDTLDHRQIAFLGHSAACNVQTLNQQVFFTGKTHGGHPFLLKIKDIFIYHK